MGMRCEISNLTSIIFREPSCQSTFTPKKVSSIFYANGKRMHAPFGWFAKINFHTRQWSQSVPRLIWLAAITRPQLSWVILYEFQERKKIQKAMPLRTAQIEKTHLTHFRKEFILKKE